jgi:Ca2+-transporting ATPase
VMRQMPRAPSAPLLDRPSVRFIVGVGTMKALIALVLLGLVPLLGFEPEAARTVVFHFMAVGQLLLTYPSRHTWTNPLPNPYLHAAVLGGMALQVAAGMHPVTIALVGGVHMPLELWGVVGISAALSWALAETWSRVVWRNHHHGR